MTDRIVSFLGMAHGLNGMMDGALYYRHLTGPAPLSLWVGWALALVVIGLSGALGDLVWDADHD